MDTIWIGPEQFGCPSQDPAHILDQFYNILKPGGKIYLLFWTSQKILPGYPLLEARLNAATSANAPYLDDMNPDNHILHAGNWLAKANFADIGVKSFIEDIAGPLSDTDKTVLTAFFQMFWGEAKNEVIKEDWTLFSELCSPESDRCILNDPDYRGFFTYTLFQGTKN